MDNSSFGELYRLQSGRVKAYFLRSGFAPAEADDQTQEVFVRAFKARSQFDPARGRLRTWIGAIAKNVARKYWRKRKSELFDPHLAETLFSEATHDGPEHREQVEFLRACLDSMENEPATMIRLRYVQGLTTRGIAQKTNRPESTVRLRLKEAQANLLRQFRQRGFL